VALMENDPARALPYATKAARDQPAASGVDLVLGKSLVETGDINGGMKHLENALRSDPDNLEVHLALVKAYANSGRKADARRERLLCLQLSSRFPNPGNANP
jgi:Flp pilus assembly protein TadD